MVKILREFIDIQNQIFDEDTNFLERLDQCTPVELGTVSYSCLSILISHINQEY